jgi:hypothetical protein
VPDNIVPLIEGNNGAFIVVIIPRDSTTVRHLTTTAGEEYRSVNRYLVTFDCDNFRGTLKRVTVFVVEQLRLHCFCMLLDAY